MKYLRPRWVVLFLWLLSGTSWAALPKVLESLEEKGIEIYDDPIKIQKGLTAYTARHRGQGLMIYVLAGGDRALIGTMIDQKGRDITEAQLEKYLPEPDYALIWENLSKATWVAEGAEQPKKIVYAFTDPNCPYCNLLWRATQAYHEDGLQVRHIMVGILREDSIGKAAAILEHSSPSEALTHHEKHLKEGGIEPLSEPDSKTLKDLEANMKLMEELGLHATPAVFYKKGDQTVEHFLGLPKLSTLAEMFGLAKQPLQDEKLKPYW